MEKPQESATGSNQTYQQMGNNTIVPPPKTVDIQLNWSEYFQGKWTARQSSDFGNLANLNGDTFNSDVVTIFLQKERNNNGQEKSGNDDDGALYIYLSEPVSLFFKVANKNTQPEVGPSDQNTPEPFYNLRGLTIDATRYTGAGDFSVTYVQQMQVVEGDSSPTFVTSEQTIFQQGENAASYSLLFNSNPPLSVPLNPSGISWFDSPVLIDTLLRPFFYQDQQNTFFVQPTMTETKIDEYDEWGVRHPSSAGDLNTDLWKKLPLQANVSVAPGLPQVNIDPTAIYQFQPAQDWVTHPATVVLYGNTFVGAYGGLMQAAQSFQPFQSPRRTLNGTVGIQLQPVVPASGPTSSNALPAGNLVNQGGLTRGALASIKNEQDTSATQIAPGSMSI
jgi:hypothetical protein